MIVHLVVIILLLIKVYCHLIGDTQNIARDVWSSKVEPITFTLTSGFTAGSAKVDTFVNPLSSDFDNCKTVNGSYSYDPGSSSSANYWIAIKFTPEQKQTLINMGYKNVHAEASFSFGGDTYASSYAHIYLITLYGNYISQYIYPEPYIIGFAENGHNDYIEPEVAYESVARDVV